MSRLFNVEVFNQTMGQGQTYFSGEEFYAMLGSADSMSAQVLVDAVAAYPTDVVVTFQTTNTLQQWTWSSTAATTTVTVSTAANTPAQDTIDVPFTGTVIGAYGRFQ